MSDDTSLRERIEAVDDRTADADQLVTVAVQPDGSLDETRATVAGDRAEASYIDDETSKPRRRALERATDLLGRYDDLPENGLVVYAGVVEGEVVDETFDELPEPVDGHVYDVSNTFDTNPLEPSVRAPNDSYGLVVVERGGAALGRHADETVTLLEQFDSDVRGKTRKGGQSEERFERRREEQKEAFFERVADAAERAFLAGGSDPGRRGDSTEGTEWDDGGTDGDAATVDALLVGGSEVTVEQFREGDHLDHRLADRVVDTYAVEYASEQGLRELVDAASEELSGRGEASERLSAFLTAVGDDDEPVAYGDDVDDALTYEAVETLLVSEAVDPDRADAFAERAQQQGGESVVVPAETDAGERFLQAFDGVGARLRFPID